LKVAVYTISLNEEQFVESWYESAKDADYLLIADTGSTDNTVELAKSFGINVASISVKPWRFDVARNASLALLPSDIDYCIALDMDEVLLPGWREELQKSFDANATRPRYRYTWSWKSDGKPGLQYGGDKIHARSGYRWKHPVHEVLVSYGDKQESQHWNALEIHHHPDSSKPRSQYLPLLKVAVEEDLEDDRNAFYYARELYFYNRYEEAAKEFKRHLSLRRATWRAERAASMRYLAKCEPLSAIAWLEKAVAEDSGRREAMVELALQYYSIKEWEGCYKHASAAISIAEKPLDYLCEDFAWGALPHDLLAISSYHLAKYREAYEHGLIAKELDPESKRIADNLKLYEARNLDKQS